MLQAGARGMLARADARRARRLRAAIIIQRNVRMLKARSQYLTVRLAALVIQSAWRGHVARTVAQDIRCEWALDCFFVCPQCVCSFLIELQLFTAMLGEPPRFKLLMISCCQSALLLILDPSILTYQCHVAAEGEYCVTQQACFV